MRKLFSIVLILMAFVAQGLTVDGASLSSTTVRRACKCSNRACCLAPAQSVPSPSVPATQARPESSQDSALQVPSTTLALPGFAQVSRPAWFARQDVLPLEGIARLHGALLI